MRSLINPPVKNSTRVFDKALRNHIIFIYLKLGKMHISVNVYAHCLIGILFIAKIIETITTKLFSSKYWQLDLPLAYKNSVIIPSLTKYAKRILLNLHIWLFSSTLWRLQRTCRNVKYSLGICLYSLTLHVQWVGSRSSVDGYWEDSLK